MLLGSAITPDVVACATADAIERYRGEVIVPRQAEIVVKLTPRPVLVGWYGAPAGGEPTDNQEYCPTAVEKR